MHELTICLHLIRLIEKESTMKKFQQVKKIWLEIGELSGIELDAMYFSFPIAAKNTVAQQAQLIINRITGEAWCETCHVNVTIRARFHPCPNCGRYQYQISQGEQLKIAKMEVE